MLGTHLGTFKLVLLLLAHSILVHQALLKLLHLQGKGDMHGLTPGTAAAQRRAGPCGALCIHAIGNRALLQRGAAGY